MTLESKAARELRKIGSGLRDSAFRFLVRHPVLAGASAALIGANAYYQYHKVDPAIIGALADGHIDPLSYLLPGYLTYLGLGLVRDYGHFPKQRYRLGSPNDSILKPNDSILKRGYHKVINNPRLSGLVVGSLAAVAHMSERVLIKGDKMDTEDFLRGLAGTPAVFSLLTETVLRTLRNSTLIKQGRREYSKRQGLVERVLGAPFDYPVVFGALTTAALDFHLRKKGESVPYISTNLGGLGLNWLIMSNIYMLAGSVLHPTSAKRMVHSTAASTAQLFGRHKSAVEHIETAVKMPMARRHKFRSYIELGKANLWNKDVNGARVALREAVSVLRSDETALSYADFVFGPRRTFVEEYKKIANSTNPVLTLRSFGDQKLLLKLDKSDYEYRVNLLCEEVFDYAHPTYAIDRRLPFSIMCMKGADGRFEHFMLRRKSNHIGESIKKASERKRIGGSIDLLGRLSELHALVTRKIAEQGGRVALPGSDTEKSIEVPNLDYTAEFMHRAISGRGRGNGYRLCRDYHHGEDQALDDLVGNFNEKAIPQINTLPKVFLHHDISPTNVLGKKYHRSIIDFGLSRIGNPLIDVDHTLDMFGIPLPDSVGFMEFYAEEYNEQSDSHIKPDDMLGCYIAVASHNALCSLGTALQREDYRSARRLLSRARKCFSYPDLKEMRGPFEAVIKNDKRLRALS